jgi:hypothetical protein
MSINTLLSNPYIMNQLVDAIDAQSGNVATVSGQAPIVVSPTAGNCVVSLPIAGTYSATNNVVKGSSATALAWGSDGDSLTFSAPLVDTAGVVSLPIAGTYSATNNVVKGSSATALVWGSDGDSLSFTLPLQDTAGVVNLEIGGVWSATNNVVKSSAENTLVWGTDNDSISFALPLQETGGIVGLNVGNYLNSTGGQLNLNTVGTPTAGQVLALSTTPGTLEWVNDNSGNVYTGVAPITVVGTSISLTDGAYLLATGGALTLDITGSAGTAGQVLALSTTPGSLAWVDNTAGSVYTGTAPIVVSGTVISVTDGAYINSTGGALTLETTGAGIQGQVLAKSATSGSLDWVDNIANIGLGINQSYTNPVITFPYQNTSTSVPILLSMTLTTTIVSDSYFACDANPSPSTRASGNYSSQLGALPATIIVPPLYYVNIVGNATFSNICLLA